DVEGHAVGLEPVGSHLSRFSSPDADGRMPIRNGRDAAGRAVEESRGRDAGAGNGKARCSASPISDSHTPIGATPCAPVSGLSASNEKGRPRFGGGRSGPANAAGRV